MSDASIVEGFDMLHDTSRDSDTPPAGAPKRGGGRFRPGQSGNPRGRPKADFDLAVEARKHAALAICVLVEAAQDASAPTAARVSAANSLLDRGFGKAPQSLEVNATVDFSAQFDAFVRTLAPPGKDAEVIEVAVVDVEKDKAQ